MLPCVLIVEDEIFTALDIECALEDAGYRSVGIAPDRQTALLLAEDADIAFVDLNLRDGLTGIEIGRQLAVEFGVKVVYMTANPTLLGKGISGTMGVLTKPCTHAVVKAAADFAAQGDAAPTRTPPDELVLFT
jgi:two-component system, response regulator PdtaR